jgi:hypothetical protein
MASKGCRGYVALLLGVLLLVPRVTRAEQAVLQDAQLAAHGKRTRTAGLIVGGAGAVLGLTFLGIGAGLSKEESSEPGGEPDDSAKRGLTLGGLSLTIASLAAGLVLVVWGQSDISSAHKTPEQKVQESCAAQCANRASKQCWTRCKSGDCLRRCQEKVRDLCETKCEALESTAPAPTSAHGSGPSIGPLFTTTPAGAAPCGLTLTGRF